MAAGLILILTIAISRLKYTFFKHCLITWTEITLFLIPFSNSFNSSGLAIALVLSSWRKKQNMKNNVATDFPNKASKSPQWKQYEQYG